MAQATRLRFIPTLAASLVVLVATLPNAALASGEQVRIAIDVPYEPFVYRTPSGQLEGFEIDLGNELCKRAQLDCSWVEQGWDGIIPGLLSRKYDAILSSMAITAERKQQVLFSDPYYNTPSVWIALRGTQVDLDDKASLKGKTVGVQRGTIRDVYITEYYGDVMQVRRYGSSQEVANDLKAGRLDFAFEDYPIAHDAFDFQSSDAPFEQFGPDISTPTSIFGEGAAIAFRPRDEALAEKFNQALEEVNADGTFKALMERYFDYDLSVNAED
ncbi:transporter substrate-binding domain-containing protein [Halotalea alkalilenta]|uniref:transporter substrate-binding domain-containing protein n=1 Tax=Halotalea alkalilenta TaxID=376489 RepID=UPI0006950B56|nr:transporter substrate-binding domain-containing protein [Halotalea alkalilenta]